MTKIKMGSMTRTWSVKRVTRPVRKPQITPVDVGIINVNSIVTAVTNGAIKCLSGLLTYNSTAKGDDKEGARPFHDIHSRNIVNSNRSKVLEHVIEHHLQGMVSRKSLHLNFFLVKSVRKVLFIKSKMAEKSQTFHHGAPGTFK